jgi:hypothetical protein
MVSIANLFDPYVRKARLYPAMLALFPVFVAILVLFPALYKSIEGALVSLAIGCGVLMFLASNVRYLGLKKEQQLYKLWGGKPTTVWLRHRDRNLDILTKQRYHAFLEKHIPELKMPTPNEETASTISADDFYESAVKWLLEYTRDKKKYPLVFEENINYGFHRNILALKPIAIAINLLCVGGILLNNYLQHHSLTFTDMKDVAALSIPLAMLLFWIFLVSPDWVKSIAYAYTRALFACCDRQIR